VLSESFLQVAVPTPLYQVFDYRSRDGRPVPAGVRVAVPFGRRQVVGVVLGSSEKTAVPANKLRAVHRVLDETPLLPADLMELLQWASRYYHHPIGEVLATALPVLLRKAAPAEVPQLECFRWVREPGQPINTRAHVQQALAQRLRDAAGALIDAAVVAQHVDALPRNQASDSPPVLLAEQASAVAAVRASMDKFQPFLLNGVTGSGKTEVYLQCIDAVLARGQQVLMLVPEISLTPQLMSRFQRRVSGCFRRCWYLCRAWA